MKTIYLNERLPDALIDQLSGKQLDDSHYDQLITESAEVYKPDGTLLLKFVKGALPVADCEYAYELFREAARKTENRGAAAGDITEEEATKLPRTAGVVRNGRYIPIKKEDGTLSNTNYAKAVESGIVGYFDKNARFPYCRMTAFNMDHYEEFEKAHPFVKKVSDAFAELVPERYANQMRWIKKSSPDFIIHDTAFTTVTVNRNFQTATHKDQGDLEEGFGVLAALEGDLIDGKRQLATGAYKGGYLVFPNYRVAVDMRSTDVLFADVHEWHSNTKIELQTPTAERISCVFYYRKKMVECGTAAEEYRRVKRARGLIDTEGDILQAMMG